ncbi:hypothetical protein Cgig2_017070 [Carnegiea gigantea]|uniref:Uncharacterized protein n=1 Tax=Carnegiea gigantea TaxID=171969 RepID=A0A9Q1GVZ7_9CARY|nr:hypothetical protein Cgig2_017070 [Carnegiea gigantea]
MEDGSCADESGLGWMVIHKGTEPYPSDKHHGGVARDRHALLTKVVSRSSSSQSPSLSLIYATLRNWSRKTPFQEARETTRHRLSGASGTWASSPDSISTDLHDDALGSHQASVDRRLRAFLCGGTMVVHHLGFVEVRWLQRTTVEDGRSKEQ